MLWFSCQYLRSPSIWPHLFCGAGHEKRRGEQLKWSLAFTLYIGSFPCAQLPGPVHTARLGRVCFFVCIFSLGLCFACLFVLFDLFISPFFCVSLSISVKYCFCVCTLGRGDDSFSSPVLLQSHLPYSFWR